MPTIEARTYSVLEGSSGSYQFTLVGNDGITPLSNVTLLTLTLTLYVIKADGSITYVNSRNAQDVLNVNNVSLSTQGRGMWSFQPSDTTLVESLAFERHIALFEWTWPGGSGKHEIVLVVKNLLEV